MKSKQLANVLIKIVGLYIFLYAISQLVSWGAIPLLRAVGGPKVTDYSLIWINAIGTGIRTVVGIVIIAMSQKIAGFWFKNEDD